jgi:hypothetical protein
MSEEKKEAPNGAAWTLSLPTDNEGEKVVFHLKKMDVDLFIAIKSMIEQNKYREGIQMFFSALKVGGDDVAAITTNFTTFQAAQNAMMEILKPMPFELKKN